MSQKDNSLSDESTKGEQATKKQFEKNKSSSAPQSKPDNKKALSDDGPVCDRCGSRLYGSDYYGLCFSCAYERLMM